MAAWCAGIQRVMSVGWSLKTCVMAALKLAVKPLFKGEKKFMTAVISFMSIVEVSHC